MYSSQIKEKQEEINEAYFWVNRLGALPYFLVSFIADVAAFGLKVFFIWCLIFAAFNAGAVTVYDTVTNQM